MPDAAQTQRKRTAKAARRKLVVAGKRKIEASSSSLTGRIRVASQGRIVHCLIPPTLFEIGIGHVVVARALPTGLIGCAFFLVDVFCLGVKDVFYRELAERDLRAYLAELHDAQSSVDSDPARARKLIRDSVAYAAALGLPAAADTSVIEAIFGDVDAGACTEVFTFGKDGRPFFVSGPNDTPARIRAIARALEESRGRGAWEYLIAAAPGF